MSKMRLALFALGITSVELIAGGCGRGMITAKSRPEFVSPGRPATPFWDDGTVHLVPDGTPQKGKIYYTSANSCWNTGTPPSSYTAPTSAIDPSIAASTLSEPSDYSNTQFADSSHLSLECYSPAGTEEVAYVSWDLSGITLSDYASFAISFIGQAGEYASGGCNGSTSMTGAGGTVAPERTIQIWRNATPIWEDIVPSSDAVVSNSTHSLTGISNYLEGNKLWIRIAAGAPTAAACSAIALDYIELRLDPK